MEMQTGLSTIFLELNRQDKQASEGNKQEKRENPRQINRKTQLDQ